MTDAQLHHATGHAPICCLDAVGLEPGEAELPSVLRSFLAIGRAIVSVEGLCPEIDNQEKSTTTAKFDHVSGAESPILDMRHHRSDASKWPQNLILRSAFQSQLGRTRAAFGLWNNEQDRTMATLQEYLRTVWGGARRLRGVLTVDWDLLRESNAPAGELFAQMRSNAIASSSFFLMLAMSVIIATFGLVANSAPAIIGAMIIAPLMAPIISLAFAVACVDRRLALLSISTIVAGVAATIAIAYLGVQIVGLQIAGSEILARASPSLLDLGVALAAGCAGAFAQVRPSIGNSVAGVAIAVALVPPLAVTGIGLSLGENAISETGRSLDALGYSSGGIAIASGAFLLFLTNLIGIVAVAALVFVIQRYGQWRKALPLIAVIVAGSFGMIPSLNRTLHEIYVKNRAISLYVKHALQPSEGNNQTSTQMLQRIQVGYRNGLLHVNADLFATRDRIGAVQENLDAFRKRLSADIREPVVLEIEIIPIEVLKVKSGPLAAKQ